MAHVPGTPHVAKIAIGWLRDAQQLENVFYVQDTTDAIFADPEGFLISVAGQVVSHLIAQTFNDVLFNQISFEDVRTIPFGGLTIAAPTPTLGAGTTTGNMPSNVTLAIKKSTGNIGRSGRGRWYWTSLDQSTLSDDNTVSLSYANALVADLFAFQGGVEGIASGLSMGIVSYFKDKVMRSSGLFEQITQWSCADRTCDSQRKRLPGRGR